MFSVQFDGNNSAQSAASVFKFTGYIISLLFSLLTCTQTKLYAHLVIILCSLIAFMVLTGKNSYKEMKNPENDVKDEPCLSHNASVLQKCDLDTKL